MVDIAPYWTIMQGDAMEALSSMEAASVHMVVTSPPYWGLRDYGLGQWQGGDAECEHNVPPRPAIDVESGGGLWRAANAEGWPNHTCGHCGAVQQSAGIGLEPTLGEWVGKIVEVMREVWRVLRNDGTVWLNLGDAYASIGRSARKESPGVGATQAMPRVEREVVWQAGGGHNFNWELPGGIRPKNLIGLPWRVAFALQDDGWILRSDIIWAKLNPMPESVKDRPTKAHEYLFLLAKQGKYFYDAVAIKTPGKDPVDDARRIAQQHDGNKSVANTEKNGLRPRRQPRTDKQRGHSRRHDGFNDRWDNMTKPQQQVKGANKRDVWFIATQSYKGAHFATFPEALVEPCIPRWHQRRRRLRRVRGAVGAFNRKVSNS